MLWSYNFISKFQLQVKQYTLMCIFYLGTRFIISGNNWNICFMLVRRLKFLERLWNQTLQEKWENVGKLGLIGVKVFLHSEKRNEGVGCAAYALSSWWNELYCGSKNKMKYFLIKITPNKDDKNSIRDFSELDMNLANSERNAYKEMVEMGAGEREWERRNISFSNTCWRDKKPHQQNPKPHEIPNMVRPRQLGYYI